MNESASKSSLASSSSGKPSTANSAGSPNSRKTRTIIVARSIRDEPAAVHLAAVRGGGPALTVPAVVNQHHTRDERSGKLAPYAALGGDEDVERFDQFLAEQRGQPSASELRAATTSPQHMLASMKRKTMSRLQLGVDDGKTASDEAGGEDPAVRKQVQQELENDARKRREEAVAHRKWLNSLPIHERVAQQRQQNALRKWRQMNHDWESFKARAARRLGKQPKELVMSRAASYREQREMYDALQKARPLSDKVGGDIWLVSLRNEGTRFVPVGNIFSGLFCPIRESTRLGPRVRRPLDYQDNQSERGQETSRPISKLEKRSLQLLARKKWRLRKQLESLQPHEVERSASSHLAVGTSDLFAWASGDTGADGGNIDDGDSVGTYSASSDDRSSSRHRLFSHASINSLKSVENGGLDEQYVGPSLRIAHIADDDEDPVANQEIEDISSENNSIVGNPPIRLSFYTPVGEQQQRSLSIANDGSTIVHYRWWRARFDDDSVELTDHLRGRRTRKDEQELESSKFTSVSRIGGTLLPGENQQFVFTFESSRAGTFLEKWLLDAEPRPRIRYGVPHANTNFDISSAEVPTEVCLSCVAEDNFASWGRRQSQLERVEQRESYFFVTHLVDEILDGVRPPEAVSFAELTPTTDVIKFYEQNGNRLGEFCDVYFSPDLVGDCHALYDQAKYILQTLPAIEPPASQAEITTNEDGIETGKTEGGEKVTPTEQIINTEDPNGETGIEEMSTHGILPTSSLDQEWNWCLETLRKLCEFADAAQYTRIRQLTGQLKKENEEVDEDDNGEDEDEDADDADDDDEEEEMEENNEIEKDSAERGQRLTRREIRENERLVRCQGLQDEITSLQPDLQERFDMLRFAACTAPYSSNRLRERLQERIGSLCSETPVVCDIVKATSAANNTSVSQIAKLEGVRSLLTRAIDEAVGSDLNHQTLFEQERRRIQGVWLYDKRSYESLAQWMTKTAASNDLLSRAGTGAADEPLAVPDMPDAPDNSGVLMMQVDLDLAPWFSLVRAERAADTSINGPPPRGELAWRLSQDLVQHATHVPTKVAIVAESLSKVLNSLSSINPNIHTVVLVSELSRPPLTKYMYKLLRNAVQAEIKSNTPDAADEVDETEPNKVQGDNERDEFKITAMKSLLQRLTPQLSLRGIAQVLQRAIQKDIVFCSTLEELQGQIDFRRKEILLNSSVSLGGNGAPSEDTESELLDQQGIATAPQIVLLEHLHTAGRELVTQNSRKREALSSKPATPASNIPPESHKPGAKKSPAAIPANRKPGTPVTSTPAAPALAAESPPSSTRDLNKSNAPAEEVDRQVMIALRDQFARMFSACVLDGIPSQNFENAFAFSSLGDKLTGDGKPPATFAGPTLSRELETWAETLQPLNTCENRPRRITAIVGGKCLESKLRLIDGLLEFVREIYFVGEVAMSLYRILHTKQQHRLTANGNRDIELGEETNKEEKWDNDAEMAEDDDSNVESCMEGETLNDGIPEEEEVEKETKELPHSAKIMRPRGSWNILIPAVENLQQKANRKCVRLLLPIDWIVGETSLEDQDLSAVIVQDEDEDDDEEEEEDIGEAEEEGEDRRKKRQKRKLSGVKLARQKPLVEPDEPDVLERKNQVMYEGERAHVILNHVSSKGRCHTVLVGGHFRM